MLEGGGTTNFEVVLPTEHEVVDIPCGEGGCKRSLPFKRGCVKSFNLSRGGGNEKFPIVKAPLTVINDQSLTPCLLTHEHTAKKDIS